MTCEILIANPLGIALAADSAVTFSRNNNQRTYAAGANKIFQLSEQQPIAVMIYSNANLSGVPWELVIKTFRKKLDLASIPRTVVQALSLTYTLSIGV